ncbi:uroporphyrinogen-III synthase [Stella humosa]|uniref:Uroporphyrinogen-III synthase n=1 Tax=Stella humosa TaxID=94 RepID=A0A3N1LDA5_9PROT|nr:uroporphyrinogen-III synthase [Stella humosa]ROP91051.1 uroporphyrinogen-III synthase [Stella humosa]BBK34599.1 hypothetical protein STHU_52330 [Stella humosa]
MRVLLTRPEAESRALAAELAAAGILSVVAPVLRIEPVPEAAADLQQGLDGARALLFTSAQAVAAFARLSARRDLPVFAVGPATAAAARDAGFAAVEGADGDGAALALLVAARLEPGAEPLVHPAGADVAGDLPGALEKAGFQLRRVVLYKAEAVDGLPAAARDALRAGTLDGVLLFSPRTAARFAELVTSAGLAGSPSDIRLPVAYCLSPAVAAAATLPWRAVRVADEANQPSLLRLVEADRPSNEEPIMSEPNATGPAVDIGTAPRHGSASGESMKGGSTVPPAPPATPTARAIGDSPPAPVLSLGATIGVAALVAILIALSAPLWRGWFWSEPRPVAAAVDFGPIEARMAALERRPPPDTAPLSDAIRRLQADIARLAERPAADPALSAEIQRLLGMVDALTRRLAETETAMRDNRLRDRIGERALVAATALRAAAERGGSFASELETARAALAEDPAAKEAVESLAPHAEKGVADAGALARRFDLLSADIVQAARRAPDGDWVDRTVERMASVLTVRRVEAPVAGTPDAHVAAAEKALAARDVAAALEALAPIREAVARAAPDWLAAAEARRAVDAATTRVSRRVAAILGRDR